MRSTELKILRIKNNLTQEAAAAKIGVTKAYYNQIENGKKTGNLDFWKNLQALYSLDDETVFKLMKN